MIRRFPCPVSIDIFHVMSTAQEIEDAILSLSRGERDKLLKHLPQLFPEFAGDSGWNRIIQDERPRAGLTSLLNQYEADVIENPKAFPRVAESDFTSDK
jgi:hypothetical protein